MTSPSDPAQTFRSLPTLARSPASSVLLRGRGTPAPGRAQTALGAGGHQGSLRSSAPGVTQQSSLPLPGLRLLSSHALPEGQLWCPSGRGCPRRREECDQRGVPPASRVLSSAALTGGETGLLRAQATRTSWTPLLSRVKEVKEVARSCLTLCGPVNCPWHSPGQNTGVGSRSLFQGIFPSQGWNPGLPHCGRILYQLSHQGSA